MKPDWPIQPTVNDAIVSTETLLRALEEWNKPIDPIWDRRSIAMANGDRRGY